VRLMESEGYRICVSPFWHLIQRSIVPSTKHQLSWLRLDYARRSEAEKRTRRRYRDRRINAASVAANSIVSTNAFGICSLTRAHCVKAWIFVPMQRAAHLISVVRSEFLRRKTQKQQSGSFSLGTRTWYQLPALAEACFSAAFIL
jgi:hypothetical protein